MGLFSREPEFDDEPEPESEPVTLFTNAPSHWPVVTSDPLIPEGVPGFDSMNAATFGGALKRSFEESNSGCKLNAVLKPLLTPDGILEIPFEVEDAGKLFPVFLYTKSSEAAASNYYGTFNIVHQKGYQDPVYYAPSPLPNAAPGNPLGPFGPNLLTRYRGQMPKGNYPILWADEINTNILATKCIKDIYRSYQAIAGIESYVLANLFHKLELVEAEVQRMRLPKKPMTIPVVGPENQHFILSVSEEKGIRFHFHPQYTAADYRDAFWSVFASYTEGFKTEALKQQMELDYSKGTPPSLRTWTNTINLLYQQPQGVAEIGVLTI